MITPAAEPAHAYVVEYRVADRCRAPACAFESRVLYGRAGAQGGPGYVVFGDDKSELFAERGVVLAPQESIDFELPETASPSSLDLEVASVAPDGGRFRVAVTVDRAGAALDQLVLEGRSDSFVPHPSAGRRGEKSRYFTPFRLPLPHRTEGPVRVVLENRGTTAVGLGAPVVRRRVEGRPPRHAIVVVVDAVAHPCLTGLFELEQDPRSSWLSRWVRSQGIYFREGISPGQLTGSFVRRFFKADYFRLEGDPSLFGQGFDEVPPIRALGPVVRLAEQGFFTEAIGSNLYLAPVLSRIGFDVDYNLESTLDLEPHPPVLAHRFDDELERHAEDDALFVIWYANTHAPWREGRADAPPLRAGELGGAPLDRSVLEPMWKNLFEAVDSLREVRQSAAKRAPNAQRLWVLTADHGHTFTSEARARPWRLTRETFDSGHMHCCLATQQEARTPFVLLDEASLGGVQVATPQSSLSAWDAVSRRFGVDLGLPATSAFALPTEAAARLRVGQPQQDASAVFDDGMVVSVGNSGSLAGRAGAIAYRSYEPAPNLAPTWAVAPDVARLLAGTPKPLGGVLREEIYDLASDPAELVNLADQRFETLLAMRRRMSDFLAEYVDTPEHPRYEYGIQLDREGTLEIHAPRRFGLAVGDRAATPSEPKVQANGSTFHLRDLDVPVGVVDLRGGALGERRVVRCASSGLPLAVLEPSSPRLNLALARTNCADRERPQQPPTSGEAWFWSAPLEAGSAASAEAGSAASAEAWSAVSAEASNASRAGAKSAGASPGGTVVPELRDALRRWGYVREK